MSTSLIFPSSLTFTTSQPLSMTSKEIADLVGSRHSDVKRSIERLAEKGIISKPPTAFSEEINNLGIPVKREHYVFDVANKRDTYVVVAQLSPEMTGAIVDRWQQLENSLVPMLLERITCLEQQVEDVPAIRHDIEDMKKARVIFDHVYVKSSLIGTLIGISARHVHKLAVECGLLDWNRCGKDNVLCWGITDEGRQYAQFAPGGKQFVSRNRPWSTSVWWRINTGQFLLSFPDDKKRYINIPAKKQYVEGIYVR